MYSSFLCFVWTLSLCAQEEILRFEFTVEGAQLNVGQKYYLESVKDTLQVDHLQLYIGQLSFWKAGQEVYHLEKEYHLLDVTNDASLALTYPSAIDFDQIRFRFGVDSLTNAAGAQGGDLDPTQGMYWAWQSGYINFKLEGVSPICPSRNNRFQYHLGGFQAPYATSQMIQLKVKKTENLFIDFPLEGLFESLNIREAYQIMSPRTAAVELAELVAELFKVAYEN